DVSHRTVGALDDYQRRRRVDRTERLPPRLDVCHACPARSSLRPEVTARCSRRPVYGGNHRVGELVSVFGAGGPSERESEALAGLLRGEAHRRQDVTRRAGARLASGAGGGGHSGTVEADEDRLVAYPGNADVAVLHEPAVLRSVDDDAKDLLRESFFEPAPRLTHVPSEPVAIRHREFQGGRQPDRSRHVVRPGSPPELLASSVDHRLE